MILISQFSIRPESRKRIEEKICSISEDEDVLSFHIERSEEND